MRWLGYDIDLNQHVGDNLCQLPVLGFGSPHIGQSGVRFYVHGAQRVRHLHGQASNENQYFLSGINVAGAIQSPHNKVFQLLSRPAYERWSS